MKPVSSRRSAGQAAARTRYWSTPRSSARARCDSVRRGGEARRWRCGAGRDSILTSGRSPQASRRSQSLSPSRRSQSSSTRTQPVYGPVRSVTHVPGPDQEFLLTSFRARSPPHRGASSRAPMARAGCAWASRGRSIRESFVIEPVGAVCRGIRAPKSAMRECECAPARSTEAPVEVFVKNYRLSHLADGALLRDLKSLVAQDRATTAAMLAHLGEVDSRKLYVPAGYHSMHAYCVAELRFSEEAAYKRIHVARKARRFPAILPAVADGRLHLTAILLLSSHLTESTAPELLAAAAGRSKSEIERMLAERFPGPDLPLRMTPVDSGTPSLQPGARAAFEQISGQAMGSAGHGPVLESSRELAPEQVEWPRNTGAAQETSAPLATGRVEMAVPRPRVTPIAPDRVALQLTVSQSTADKLAHARELLGHRIEHGDIAEILDQALDGLIVVLEKAKFAATGNPRASQRAASRSERHIPSRVKRQVWKRDGGRCTFVSATGHRCASRSDIEFDHVEAVARGGRATVANVRLLCRAHNQYMAECTFGAEFMKAKRQRSREAAASRAMKAATSGPASPTPPAPL